MKKYKFGYFDWETFLTQNVCYSASYHTPRVKLSKQKRLKMNIKIKIKIIPTKQKPSFKILLSNSYDAFDSKNCLDLFCLSSSFFENNAPVLQNVAVFFNYQLTHKCGNRFGLISNRNIKKTTIKSLNNGKFRCISRFPIHVHLPEVFE